MLKIVKSLLFVETVWRFQRLPNNIKLTMTNVKVQKNYFEWKFQDISTKKRNIMYLSKTKMGKREPILEA